MASPTYITGDFKTDVQVNQSDAQASAIANLAITTDLTGVDTNTDMTAAQAAQIEVDLTATAAKLNAILVALEGVGILAE